jgi:uncharacterized phage protein (TIGR01671 family)
MREILFRGKTNDGEWVVGNLIHQTEHYGDPIDRYHILYTGEFDGDYYDSVEVIPETVGQYTGMLDDRGKRLFEGDIVKCEVLYEVGQYPHYETEIKTVKYDRGFFYPTSRCEIIGNIYDNPELLEEKKNDLGS